LLRRTRCPCARGPRPRRVRAARRTPRHSARPRSPSRRRQARPGRAGSAGSTRVRARGSARSCMPRQQLPDALMDQVHHICRGLGGHNASMMSVMPTGLFALAASSPTRVRSRSDKRTVRPHSRVRARRYVCSIATIASSSRGLVNGPSLRTEEDEDATQAVPVRGNSRPALPLPANHYRSSAMNITDAD
jgi:hypothetical protein